MVLRTTKYNLHSAEKYTNTVPRSGQWASFQRKSQIVPTWGRSEQEQQYFIYTRFAVNDLQQLK